MALKERIAEMNGQVIRKKCELEELKLVRKEISEQELLNTIREIEAECEEHRGSAVRLMRRYSGYKETEGMDEEDYHNYKYSNLALRQYDELLEELTGTLRTVLVHRVNKEVEGCECREKNEARLRDWRRSGRS